MSTTTTPRPQPAAAHSEPAVIMAKRNSNSVDLEFHDAALLVLPNEGADNFSPQERVALAFIVRACNSHEALIQFAEETQNIARRILLPVSDREHMTADDAANCMRFMGLRALQLAKGEA